MAQEKKPSFPYNALASEHTQRWLQFDMTSLPVSCSLLMPESKDECHFGLPVKNNQAETFILLHSDSFPQLVFPA